MEMIILLNDNTVFDTLQLQICGEIIDKLWY